MTISKFFSFAYLQYSVLNSIYVTSLYTCDLLQNSYFLHTSISTLHRCFSSAILQNVCARTNCTNVCPIDGVLLLINVDFTWPFGSTQRLEKLAAIQASRVSILVIQVIFSLVRNIIENINHTVCAHTIMNYILYYIIIYC